MDVLDADAGRFFRSPHQVWKASSTASKGRPTTQNIRWRCRSQQCLVWDRRGGTSVLGTVFSVSLSGSETILHNFIGNADGENPSAGLEVVNGLLYGTTQKGGRDRHSCSGGGCGTVFKISRSGTEEILYRFRGYPDDGSNPNGYLTFWTANSMGRRKLMQVDTKEPYFESHRKPGAIDSLMLRSKADEELRFQPLRAKQLFGCGNALRLRRIAVADERRARRAGARSPQAPPRTTYKSLYSFGKRFWRAEPKAALVEVNGTLYGTTFAGGSTKCIGGYGIVFTITPTGKEKVLYRFRGGR